MRNLIAAALAAALLVPLLGCGGGITQADMRRHALRRSSPEEDETQPAASRNGRQPVDQQALEGDSVARRPAGPGRAVSGPAPPAHRPPASSPSALAPASPPAAGTDANSGPLDAPAALPTNAGAQEGPLLDPIERRQRTLDNLAQIGEALRRYSQEKKQVFAAHALRAAASATPAPAEPPADLEHRPATATATAAARTSPDRAAAVMPAGAPAAVAPPAAAGAERPDRRPVPDPVSLERARRLVRDLYEKEHAAQQHAHQHRALAQKMIKQCDEMPDDPAGQYALLEAALKTATRAGDTSTAVAAVEQLAAQYAVNELEMMRATLVAVARKNRDHATTALVLTKAGGLIEQALREEQYETADSLCQIALAAARKLGNREAAGQLLAQSALVAKCQGAFADVQRILRSAQDADDPEGSLRVGRYYGLLRGEWDKGLPLLARGSHARLRELAEADLANPTIPEEQLQLADGWWEQGTTDETCQAALYARAAFWYQRALPALPTGLWRAKAEMRLQAYRRLYGHRDAAVQ